MEQKRADDLREMQVQIKALGIDMEKHPELYPSPNSGHTQ
jgi:hypothetical protein